MMFIAFIYILFLTGFVFCRTKNDPYQFLISDSCIETNKFSLFHGKECIKEKSSLSCFKIIDEIKRVGLKEYLYGKTWYDTIYREQEYIVDSMGIVTIKMYWPDGNVSELKDFSKFYEKDGYLHYHEPKHTNLYPQHGVDLTIKYIGCTIVEGDRRTSGLYPELILSDGNLKNLNIKNTPEIRIINQKNYIRLYVPNVLTEREVQHTVSIDL